MTGTLVPVSYADPVAVVAVTHASADTLTRFLTSVRSATSAPLDIVLASQGELDVASRSAAQAAGARVIDTGDVGYGRAANTGVRDTTAEFVVLVDPDVVFEPGSLDQLLAAAQRWSSGAAFGPLIHTEQGSVYPSARAVPSLTNGIGHAVFGWWWPANRWTKAYRHELDAPAERVTGWLVDTCVLLRRDAFDAVGGFDADRLVYLEDLDLGERFVKAGWHNVYVPSAVVIGSGRQKDAIDPSRVAADQHRSVSRYLSRRYSGWRWFPLRLSLSAGLGLRSLLTRLANRLAKASANRRRSG
jgi:N-acetylglucosaminyl-diphospho-decaprenol L-rhamnosyltransferase